MDFWNILVIDDEAEASDDPRSRYVKYKKLENYVHSGRSFKLQFAGSVDDARQLLAKSRFSMVLLDVRLRGPGWADNDSGEIFQELFFKADGKYTVGLVSSEWNDSSMEVVRRFLVQNPKVAMPLFFTFRDFENEAFAAIASQIVTHVRRQRNLYELELPPDTSLRLLHFSDFHFGSAAATRSLAGISNVTLLCDKIKQAWPERHGAPEGPDLVVVTGDVGNTGHPDDYVGALDWFRKFAAEFKWALPSPRVVIVPGNHDFSVPLCATFRIQLSQDKMLSLSPSGDQANKLAVYSMLPFAEFAAQISSIGDGWGKFPLGAWVEFGFAEYGIVFSGFNTSKCHDGNAWPKRCVDTDDITVVRDAFINNSKVSDLSGLFHVALSHHSLIRYAGAQEEIGNAGECDEHLLDKPWSPHLFLHGHEHRRWGALPSGNDYMVVAAPSPSKSDPQALGTTPCGLNLLELVRSKSVVSSIEAKSLVRLEAGWQVLPLPGKSSWVRS